MKLVIVHYHLRPGGIRRIIELATPHLVRRIKRIESVVLACGEAADGRWNEAFHQRLHPTPVEFRVVPAFNYLSKRKSPAPSVQNEVIAGLENILGDATRGRCLVWAHNLGVGRNLLLARELARVCEARRLPLVLHHHDWWFDNRWRRWHEMRRFGIRTLDAAARCVFPASPRVRHVAINRTDAGMLRRHFRGACGWLPNLTERGAAPSPARVRAARQWLERHLAHRHAPVWILPCRLLRRKNIAEALLLTRWLRPDAWMVTTGGVSSADEIPYYEKLNAAAQRHRWRLRLGVLQGDETRKPAVTELLAASEAVLLTSIQEGFGLPFLEATAARRPLIARALPNIAPDLEQFGLRFPQYYGEIRIHTDLFDWQAERARQRRLFRLWQRGLPHALRESAGEPAMVAARLQPDAVPFSRLTFTAQLEVLAQPVSDSWERCAPLNPFLKSWRERAEHAELQTTTWPRGADRWLGARAYAGRFVRILRTKPGRRVKNMNPAVLQADFIREKLASYNQYPLLWHRDT